MKIKHAADSGNQRPIVLSKEMKKPKKEQNLWLCVPIIYAELLVWPDRVKFISLSTADGRNPAGGDMRRSPRIGRREPRGIPAALCAGRQREPAAGRRCPCDAPARSFSGKSESISRIRRFRLLQICCEQTLRILAQTSARMYRAF